MTDVEQGVHNSAKNAHHFAIAVPRLSVGLNRDTVEQVNAVGIVLGSAGGVEGVLAALEEAEVRQLALLMYHIHSDCAMCPSRWIVWQPGQNNITLHLKLVGSAVAHRPSYRQRPASSRMYQSLRDGPYLPVG